MAGVALLIFTTWSFVYAETSDDFGGDIYFFPVGLLLFAAFTVSAFTIAIGLFLNWPFAWWLAITCHCILLILVLFTYVCLVYTLIHDWGRSTWFYSGGSPKSLAVATMIFVVVETLAAIPLVILIRNRPDSRIASANISHEV